MFEHHTEYRNIVVTGPQRSGTRLCAKSIAHDTGYDYVDEEAIRTDSIYKLYKILTTVEYSMVIQCPALCRLIHGIRSFEDVLVVMVQRPIPEIIASMKRIGWTATWAEMEMDLYADVAVEQPSVPGRKYAHWHFTQRRLLPNTLDVQYHDLEAHPLWVPEDERVGWGWNQTEVKNDKSN